MIIQVYNILPSWIFTNENKPSKQLFNMILSQSETSKCQAQFVQHPNSFNIKIRLSDENWTKYNWNLICLDEKIYYKVTNVEILQQQKHIILNVDAEIDLYLSYIINLFDETSTSITPVFFKQKHLNRYTYGGENSVINFSQQFYLKNKHPALNDVGVNLIKFCDVVSSSNYNAPLVNLSTPLLTNNYAGGSAYCYALCKISPSASFAGNFGNNLLMYQEIPNLVAINIASSTVINQTVTLATSVSWIDFLKYVGSDVYTDYVLLPLPIEQAQVYNGSSLNPIITDVNELNTNSNYCTSAYNVTRLETSSGDWENYVAWLINPQHLYYTVTNIQGTFLYYELTNVWNEPYIYQYCKFRARMSGEDSFVDLTYFNNFTPSNAALSLESFVINMNYPVTQITNINFNLMNFNSLQPYTYNSINDAYYTINLKCVYPSVSSNWNNFLLNNLNQYHTALNIAHFALQQAQANVVLNTLGGLKDIFNGNFNFLNTTESLLGSVFNEKIQQQEYNYLNTGKQQDMSRVGNERLATTNNVIAYNNYLLTFVFERPVQYEINLIINYCMLNGYVVDRWIPWFYWKNRTYCNYVKCCYFSDCLLSSLIYSYKKAIDEIMNNGVRIWMKASMNLFDDNTLNLSSFLIENGFTNNELNENNQELIYLNTENND